MLGVGGRDGWPPTPVMWGSMLWLEWCTCLQCPLSASQRAGNTAYGGYVERLWSHAARCFSPSPLPGCDCLACSACSLSLLCCLCLGHVWLPLRVRCRCRRVVRVGVRLGSRRICLIVGCMSWSLRYTRRDFQLGFGGFLKMVRECLPHLLVPSLILKTSVD